MATRIYNGRRGFLRATAVLLAVSMLGTALVTHAAAGAGTCVAVESAQAGAGDTVSVAVTISGNSGISNFDFAVTYDDGLVLTGGDNTNCLCAKGLFVANPETGYVIWANSGDVTDAEGSLFKLTFAVDENAAPGDYEIFVGVKDGGAFGSENGGVTADFVSGKITVAGAAAGQPVINPPVGNPSGGSTSGGKPQDGNTGTQAQPGGNGGTAETGNQSADAPAAPVEIVFSDVAEGMWYYDCVQSMAAAGVVKGYPDHTFRPSSNVTCGEALKLILLASGHELTDSSAGHWAENYYNFALGAGLVKSGAALDAPIARIDIARIMAGAGGITADTGVSPFYDTNDANVTALYNAGLLKGYGDGRFGPDEMLTRAELTMIVWRLYSYTTTGIIPE